MRMSRKIGLYSAGGGAMEFSYTGQYRFTGDRKGDWAIEFLRRKNRERH